MQTPLKKAAPIAVILRQWGLFQKVFKIGKL